MGEFDEGFKGAYGEDCDYHVRCHAAGVSAVSLALPYYHKASGTLTANPEKRAEIHALAEENRAYFYQKHGFRIGSVEYAEFFLPDSEAD